MFDEDLSRDDLRQVRRECPAVRFNCNTTTGSAACDRVGPPPAVTSGRMERASDSSGALLDG
jgi:hypothetical protein